ncbi:WXG100 family type VII secretion target [Streptomyces sp. TLI_146]|uniref:WXG100 family type VII secretion target n=1 Tax=Streptomyces sp. TLI_146 TaxID=1938858 RepID=UPI000C705BA0|nr:WXG100 family type VII secretion target [Streptomyces sp. TLI_146]PKV87376.1 hypothetical protein BX283_4975 [Streptomyces sp. TLI_146]
MLTYELIMKTDFSQLATVATKWDDMAGELKKLEERYKTQVQNVSLDGTWTGQASQFSRPNFAATHTQYVSAQTEAKAVASLLREAQAQFVDLKKRVESARDDAVKAGMKVSETGAATFDYSKVSATEADAVRHDPGLRATENSWSQHIAQAVTAMNDADQGVKIALEAVGADIDIFDETRNGFNARASGDVEYYEAKAMIPLAEKIKDGDKLSPEELAQAESLLRDNSHDKVFTQTVLQSLGPDGAMKFTRHVNDWSLSDKSHKADYAALERGFAMSLATATTVPGKVAEMPPGSAKYNEWLNSPDGTFYKGWMEGMAKAGTHNYGKNDRPLLGYQLLTTLMQKADGPYDDQYLNALGGQMIAAERGEKYSIFGTWGADYKGVTPDPVDALLGVMSKNPDAATFFFDPADKTGADHLHYLAGHGKDTRHWPQHMVSGGVATKTDDLLDSHAGLGLALEAAATGHPPFDPNRDPWPVPTHTEAQARVMNGIIGTLDQGTSTEVHKNMQAAVAKALAEYTPDTHQILGNAGGGYIRGMHDGFWVDDQGMAHLATSPDKLVHVMRGLSEDPAAYADLSKTELRYLDQELAKLPKGAGPLDQNDLIAKSGNALGTYTAIREDVLNDGRVNAYSSADWKAKVAYHVIGGIVTPMTIPTAGGGSIVVGDAMQRGVDTLAWMWGNEMKAGADAEANAKISDTFLNADTQMRTVVNTWGEDRYGTGDPEARKLVDEYIRRMHDSHTTGLSQAKGYLTDTTN